MSGGPEDPSQDSLDDVAGLERTWADRLARIDAALANPEAAVPWAKGRPASARAMTVWIGKTDAAEIEHQDSGQAAIIEIGGPDVDGPFVRLHSWRAETGEHPLLDSLAGKRVRVTVELVPDDEPGTLAQWLHWRFGPKVPWSDLGETHQAYWEHEAVAARRAVERGGFKDGESG